MKASEQSQQFDSSAQGARTNTLNRVSPPHKRAKITDFQTIIQRANSRDFIEFEEMDIDPKKISDCIHGVIDLPPCVVAVMDTPQFQRLRYLKQTGTCHLVYPNATHNRFQHSIGVAHLARKFALALQQKYPTYLDDKDILCVMLAGLCHDLGHGPFSHLWEHFIAEAVPSKNYHHEDTSIKMLDRLLDQNKLRPVLKNLGGLDETDILFIKELIVGPLDEKSGLAVKTVLNRDSTWPYRGRGEEKSFLYEIVANKISGVDVDKWDYFLRDDYYMKVGHIFDPHRFIEYARVEKVEGRKRICIRDKESEMLVEMYRDRARLHRSGYQHRVTLVADRMLIDAWLSADPHITIKGSNGQKFHLSEVSYSDLEAHEKLEDEYVKFKIMETDLPELEEAQSILKRYHCRDFYETVAHIDIKEQCEMSAKSKKELLSDLHTFARKKAPELDANDLTLLRKTVSPGMKFDRTYFYRKDGSVVQANAASLSKVFRSGADELFVCLKKAQNKSVAIRVVNLWREKWGVPEIHEEVVRNGLDITDGTGNAII